MNDYINKDARPALESLLSGLNRDQLQSLLLKLAEQEPSLITTIERQATLLQTSASQPTTPPQQAPPKPPIAVDTKAVHRQVRSSIHSLDRMRSSEAYWHVGAVVDEIGQLVEQAWALIKADNGQQALTIQLMNLGLLGGIAGVESRLALGYRGCRVVQPTAPTQMGPGGLNMLGLKELLLMSVPGLNTFYRFARIAPGPRVIMLGQPVH